MIGFFEYYWVDETIGAERHRFREMKVARRPRLAARTPASSRFAARRSLAAKRAAEIGLRSGVTVDPTRRIRRREGKAHRKGRPGVNPMQCDKTLSVVVRYIPGTGRLRTATEISIMLGTCVVATRTLGGRYSQNRKRIWPSSSGIPRCSSVVTLTRWPNRWTWSRDPAGMGQERADTPVPWRYPCTLLPRRKKIRPWSSVSM